MKRRKQLKALLAQKDTNKVSVLLGPRQVGKTTLLRELHRELGGLFLDVDIFSNYEKLATYERFVGTLKLEGYDERSQAPFFVFLDEFQRYPDLSLVLKNVHDHHPTVKVFATGSSSLTIKDAIQESLAGRKIVTRLDPLSFEELLAFRDREDLLPKLEELRGMNVRDYSVLVPELLEILRELLVFGGYPGVVLASPRDRREVLAGIFDLYVKKDLVEYLRLEKLRGAKLLIEQLALNHGGSANYTAYGQVSDLDTKTVKSYIELLEETFLVVPIRPYFRDKTREISKAPRVYFLDNGVRNYFCNNFNEVSLRTDAGALFEGYVLGELIKSGVDPEAVRYYRAKDGREVNFVIDQVSQLVPIEVKHKTQLKAGDTAGLRHFLEAYQVPRGYLVSLGEIGDDGAVQEVDAFNARWLGAIDAVLER
jgi:hypothetical protein